MLDEVYRQAFVDVLYDKAKTDLCPTCSKLLENEALNRYRTLMAKRRKEIAGLQMKVEKERGLQSRRKELEKQNKDNNSRKGIAK